jgi:hypothetical protein
MTQKKALHRGAFLLSGTGSSKFIRNRQIPARSLPGLLENQTLDMDGKKM